MFLAGALQNGRKKNCMASNVSLCNHGIGCALSLAEVLQRADGGFGSLERKIVTRETIGHFLS